MSRASRAQKRADRLWAERVNYKKFWAAHGDDKCGRCGVIRRSHRYTFDRAPQFNNCCSRFEEPGFDAARGGG